VAYVRNIETALAERYPAHAAEFARNAAAYVTQLEALDREVAARLDAIPADRRKLVTTHDAFRYFGRRYGIDVVATIWGVSTEREPSAREIRRIVDAIRAQGVHVVFVETTINPALMVRIAEETGIHVGTPLYGDSVGKPGGGADSYLGMMRSNLRALVDGLTGGPQS
jgi:ABC-type Zn uptake system ZnuABC Zn-binding protein ZnuA